MARTVFYLSLNLQHPALGLTHSKTSINEYGKKEEKKEDGISIQVCMISKSKLFLLYHNLALVTDVLLIKIRIKLKPSRCYARGKASY